MQRPNPQKSWGVDLLLLTFVLGSLFFILLGTRPLFIPDEGRYAEIAREMVTSGNYITPHLNEIKYFEKPVLFYWLAALAIKIGGLNLWSIRSVNALISLLGCLITYATARKIYNRHTGILAALILGTSLLYFIMAHMISLDSTLTIFLTGCLYAFLLGTQSVLPTQRLYFCIAAIAASCAVLTKGLVGIVFPLMIASLWMGFFNEWPVFKKNHLLLMMLIFLLVTVPWHFLVGWHNPEFFYFYFIEQHFLRYTVSDVGHQAPAWYFIPTIMLGFFPWIVFLPQAIFNAFSANEGSNTKSEVFFIIWILFIFTFFSFSQSKLIPYILPVFPPLAILTARYLVNLYSSQANSSHALRVSYICLLFIVMGIAYGLFFFTKYIVVFDPKFATVYLRSAALMLFAGTCIACFFAYRHQVKAIGVTLVTTYFFLLIVLASLPFIDTRTTLPLVQILQPFLQPQDEIITYNQYYQDLPFYLKRRISILNWRNELSYGMRHQSAHNWLIDDATFWEYWHSKKRVFAIMDKTDYALTKTHYPYENFYLWGKTATNTLVSNQPSPQDPKKMG